MKKRIVTIVAAFGFFLSAFVTSSAMAGSFGFGVMGSGLHIATSGNETDTSSDDVNSSDQTHSGALASIFAEYSIGDQDHHGMTFGVSYSPMRAQIGSGERGDTRSDSTEDSNDSGTYRAKANVSKAATLYLEPTLMYDSLGVYFKGGLARIKVESLEEISFGEDSSAYPDAWVNGYLFGLGITKKLNDGLFYKLEAVRTVYDEVSMESQSGNRNTIKATPKTLGANILFGYKF